MRVINLRHVGLKQIWEDKRKKHRDSYSLVKTAELILLIICPEPSSAINQGLGLRKKNLFPC